MQKHKALGFKVFLPLVALLLTACPNLGGGPPRPSSIELTVEDPGGSFVAAAYQVGTGNWQALNMTGTTTKTATIQMNNETRYGVAVRCNNMGVMLIQATSTELANPKIVCSLPSPVLFTVNVDISSISVNDGYKVCVNDQCSPLQGATSATVTAYLEPGNNRDLLITLKDSQSLVKVAKVVKGVNVTNGGSTSVSLGSGDQITPVPLNVPDPPQGYEAFPFAFVFYLSANGTASGSVNASFTSYRPVSGFKRGDLYWALTSALNTEIGLPTAALASLQFFNSGAPSLAFPTPWERGSLTVTQTAHPKVTGLTRSESDLQSYQITLLKDFNQNYYSALLSKAWLGDATEYTLPDLSSLLGYTPLQNGDSAYLNVSALLSNKTLSDLNTLITDLSANSSSFASSFASSADGEHIRATAVTRTGFAAGDYIKQAQAFTNFFTVGGGDLTLP